METPGASCFWRFLLVQIFTKVNADQQRCSESHGKAGRDYVQRIYTTMNNHWFAIKAELLIPD
jgi:hypothetical protein